MIVLYIFMTATKRVWSDSLMISVTDAKNADKNSLISFVAVAKVLKMIVGVLKRVKNGSGNFLW